MWLRWIVVGEWGVLGGSGCGNGRFGGGDGARGLMFKVGEVAGSWVVGVLCYLIWFVSFDVSL